MRSARRGDGPGRSVRRFVSIVAVVVALSVCAAVGAAVTPATAGGSDTAALADGDATLAGIGATTPAVAVGDNDTNGTMSFNGRGYASAPNSTSLTIRDQSITIEAWLKPDGNTSDTDAVIVHKGAMSGGNSGYTLRLVGDGEERRVYFDIGRTFNSIRSNSGLPADQWTHVAAVYDGANMQIYLDGRLDAQRQESDYVWHGGDRPLRVATSDSANSQFYAGEIDDLRIWDSARGIFQVQDGMYTELSGSEPGLAAYYPVSASGSVTVRDVASGNDLSLRGDGSIVAPDALPVAPRLYTHSGNGQVDLTWVERTGFSGANDADRFKLYRSTVPDGSDRMEIATLAGATTSYTDTGLSNGGTYHYEVAAVVDGRESDFSSMASATPYATSGGSSLSLDGVDDYATMSDRPSLHLGKQSSLTGSRAMAIEVWLKPDGNGSDADAMIVHKGAMTGDRSGYTLRLVGTGAERKVYFDVGRTFNSLTSNSGIPADEWTHVAAVYDGSTMQIYVNGELDAERQESDGIISSRDTPLRIGTDNAATGRFYAGRIDDLRIWNRSRSDTQVRQSYRGEVTGDEAGLVAYWKFDDAGDSVARGSAYHKSTAQLYREASIDPPGIYPLPPRLYAESGNSVVSLDWDERVPGEASQFIVYRSTVPDGSDRTQIATLGAETTSYQDSGAVNGGTYYYEVTAVDADGQESDYAEVATATPYMTSGGGSLQLDGVNDYATVSDRPSLYLGRQDAIVGADTMTIEVWVKPEANESDDDAVILSKGPMSGGNSGYTLSLVEVGEERRVYFDIGRTFDSLTSTSGLPSGQWTHVAAVYDGANMKIYVDGRLDAQRAENDGLWSGPGRPLRIGTEDAAGTRFFAGQIDEIRVWKTARSEGAILDAMNRELVGNETGLAAYWRFDDAGTAPAVGSGVHHTEATLSGDAVLTRGGTYPLQPRAYARGDNGTVRVEWTPADADAVGEYRIYRSTVEDRSDRTLIASANPRTRSYTDTGLANGGDYYYEVTVVDESGQESDYSYPATARPTTYARPAGQALNFTASKGSFATVSDAPSLHLGRQSNLVGTREMTVEAWIRPDGSDSDADAIIVHKGAMTGDRSGYTLRLVGTGTDRKVFFDVGRTFNSLQSASTVPADRWTHVAGTYDGSTMQIYLNGKLDAQRQEGDAIISARDRPLRIGSDAAGSAQFFDGQIDEVRLWNTWRTDDQINRSMGRELVGNETGLVGYWRGCNYPASDVAQSSAERPLSAHLTDVDCVDSTLPWSPNLPPTARFTTSPSTLTFDTNVTFDGRSSTDPEGNITDYDWDLNSDGRFDAAGPTVVGRYVEGRNVTVTLRVTDGAGLVDRTTRTFRIVNGSTITQALPGMSDRPSDPDGDGVFEDTTGDGVVDLLDVQALYVHRNSAAVQSMPGAFDYNGDGRFDLVDVQALFTQVT